MSALIKESVHYSLAEAVYNELQSRQANYYYYIGKVLPWATPLAPDTPLGTQSYEHETRNRIITIKKIQPSDVSLVVRRIDWLSGTVYDQYDGDYSPTFKSSTGASSLKDSNFYVLTSDFHVYKCLFNNNGSPSTEKPYGTSVTPLTTVDGYKWKYMYTIPLSLRNRFLTTEYMPVQRSITNSYYSNGEVDSVIVSSRGSGYLGNAVVSLTVNGEFLGGEGNSIANLVPVINLAGQITDVIIKDAGNNYSSANITINDSIGTGTGYYNTESIANLVPVLYGTKIDRVVINDPGINYKSNIQTDIVVTGDGEGADFLPFVNEVGELESVIITSRGSGYSYIDLEVVGDGTGANVISELSVGDLDTNQSSVELSAISGAIHAFRVINAGNNYTSANVSVIGDGINFSGNVVISNSNTVSSVTISNAGFDYTYANVTITGDGTGAQLEAIFPPYGGHGFDPVRELFADTLVFYSTINNENIHEINVNNDYRQFGIVKNIKQYGNQRTFANTTGTSCFLVTFSTLATSIGGTLERDAVLELSSNRTKHFEVVETSANNKVLLTSLNNYELSASNSLYDANTDTTFVVTSVDNLPTINKFSGDLLFIDNRTKVSYSDQQLVTLRTTINL